MSDNVTRLESAGVIAIVRLDDYRHATEMVRSLQAGGVTAVEFTYTNPLAGVAIEETKRTFGDAMLIGAGTVLDPETARAAMLLGADFIVTPTINVETIRICTRYRVPSMIGAFTPTEILTAWEAGASFVKVFPASTVGPRYLKDVLGPLPQIRLVPTGGVTAENAGEFIRAGAASVAAGGNLVDAQTVADGNWQVLTDRAVALVDAVRSAHKREHR